MPRRFPEKVIRLGTLLAAASSIAACSDLRIPAWFSLRFNPSEMVPPAGGGDMVGRRADFFKGGQSGGPVRLEAFCPRRGAFLCIFSQATPRPQTPRGTRVSTP